MRISDWSSDVCSSDLFQFECYGIERAGDDCPPICGLTDFLHIGTNRIPGVLPHILRQPSLYRRKIEEVDDALIECRQFRLIEAGRSAAKAGEVETLKQRFHLRDRLNRITGSDSGEQGDERYRFDILLAESRHAKRSQAFGELDLRPDKQCLMREERRTCSHGREHLDLRDRKSTRLNYRH